MIGKHYEEACGEGTADPRVVARLKPSERGADLLDAAMARAWTAAAADRGAAMTTLFSALLPQERTPERCRIALEAVPELLLLVPEGSLAPDEVAALWPRLISGSSNPSIVRHFLRLFGEALLTESMCVLAVSRAPESLDAVPPSLRTPACLLAAAAAGGGEIPEHAYGEAPAWIVLSCAEAWAQAVLEHPKAEKPEVRRGAEAILEMAGGDDGARLERALAHVEDVVVHLDSDCPLRRKAEALGAAVPRSRTVRALRRAERMLDRLKA